MIENVEHFFIAFDFIDMNIALDKHGEFYAMKDDHLTLYLGVEIMIIRF